MTKTMEQKAAEIFIAVLDLDGKARRAYLDDSCKSDPSLRARVDRLLAADDPSSPFLQPLQQNGSRNESAELIDPGTNIGRYRVIRMIAAGGMGAVYEAEQDQPKRTVALKVMKRGFAGRSALRRFEHEAQFLAALRHPGIAQVHDMGVYDDGSGGVPFFVMEFIADARSMTDHARSNNLGTRDRLELFIAVCEAVHHGHQKGVIHRDLKPDNILIDSTGSAKVIDFGVARATDADIAVTTMQTDVGQLIGTLQYMSPEQCEADPHDLDVRSDVYSLGVVLYELLTKHLPYDVTRARVFEATRLIRETIPTRPSSFNRALRGDLETIVIKALEKDRARRYQSASELAADIRRYLSREPIAARPPSAIYQLRTFARRNKAIVGGVVATLAVLVLGLAGITAMYLRAEAQREAAELNEQRALAAEAEAEERAEHLEKVVGFQARLLSGINVPLMGERLKEDLLERVRASIEASESVGALASPNSQQPATSLQADSFSDLNDGEADEAAGVSDPPNQSEMNGWVDEFEANLTDVNFTDLALRSLDANIFAQALVAINEEFADQPLVQARLLQTLATTLQSLGLFEQAMIPQEEALAIRQRELGDEHPHTVTSLLETGWLLTDLRRYDESERYLRDGLDMRRRLFGDEHRATLDALTRLGVLLHAQLKGAEAEECFRTALEILQRDPTTADDDPFVLTLISNIGFALDAQGKRDEGEHHHRAASEARRRAHGDLDRRTLLSIKNLAISWRLAGRPEEAEPYYREALTGYRRLLGDEHPDTIGAVHQLGLVCRELGKLDEALALAEEAVRASRRLPSRGPDRRQLAFHLLGLGRALTALTRFEEAEPHLLEGHEILYAHFGLDHEFTAVAAYHLAELYGLWHAAAPGAGRDRKAARWAAKSTSVTVIPPLRPGGVTTLLNREPPCVVEFANAHLTAEMKHTRQVSVESDDWRSGSFADLGRNSGNTTEVGPADSTRELGEPSQLDVLMERTEHLVTGVNFTSLVLKALDENIFAPALEVIDEEFGGQPLVKARLLQTMAVTLRELGLTGRALAPQEEALAIRRRELGDEHVSTLKTINNMALLLGRSGRFTEAEPFAHEALDTARRIGLTDESRIELTAMNTLGLILPFLDRIEEAEHYYREALAVSRRHFGDDDPTTLMLVGNVAFVLSQQPEHGKWSQAEPLFREALDARRQLYGDDHPRTLWVLANLGVLLRMKGELEEAEEYLRQALDGYRRARGEEHQKTTHAYHQLGIVLREMGQLEQAERLGAQAVRLARSRFHTGSVGSVFLLLGHGQSLMAMGRFAEAEIRMIEAHAIFEYRSGSASPNTLHAAEALAELYDAWHAAEPGGGRDARAAAWRAVAGGDWGEQESAAGEDFEIPRDAAHRRRPAESPGPAASPESPPSSDSTESLELPTLNQLTVADARFAEFERMLDGINFTDLAIRSLDANIFDGALRTLDEEFADQPLVKARLLQVIANTLRRLGLAEKALAPQKEALAIRQNLLGEKHADALESQYRLAVLYVHLFRMDEAEQPMRAVIEVRRRDFPEDFEQLVRSLDGMGFVVFHRQQYVEAEAYFREAMELGRRTLGSDHGLTLDAMGNLSLALSSLERHDEAEPYARGVYEARRERLGPDHTGTLWAMTHFGRLLSRMGRLAEAEMLLDEAFQRYRRMLGEDHLRTLDALISLATVFHRQDRLDVAEQQLRRYVETSRKVFGDNNTRTIHGINHHGIVLREMGRLEEAERAGAEATARARRSLPPDHLSIPFFLMRHGQALAALSRFEEAEDRLLEAHGWFESIGGAEHEWTVEAAEALAEMYRARNAGDSTMAYESDSSDRRETSGIDDHRPLHFMIHEGPSRKTARTVVDQVEEFERALSRINFTDLAIRSLDANIFDGALRTLDEEFSDQPLVKARLLHTLGTTLLRLGLYERGIVSLEGALEIRRSELGNDDPLTLATIDRLALTLSRGGRSDEGELYAIEALEGRRKVLGPEHPATLTSLNTLGHLLFAQGRYSESARCFREALGIRERVSGELHPRTIGVMGNLAYALESLATLESTGEYAEAEAYYREAIDRLRKLPGEREQMLWMLNKLGAHLRYRGWLDEAEPILREAAEGYRSLLGDEHYDTIHAIHQLGRLYQATEQWDEAERLGAQAVAGARRGLPYLHQMTAFAKLRHGQALAALGRFEEAEAQLLESHNIFQRIYGLDHWHATRTADALAELYDSWRTVSSNGDGDH